MTAGKLLYAGPSGLSREIRVAWTSLAAVDPFRVVSAGRSRLESTALPERKMASPRSKCRSFRPSKMEVPDHMTMIICLSVGLGQKREKERECT